MTRPEREYDSDASPSQPAEREAAQVGESDSPEGADTARRRSAQGGEPEGERSRSDADESAGKPPQQPRLTVAAVARRLGVAPATLRTWDRRYGLGPSEHASGRHRRYAPEDVARLEQMQRALLRGASPAEAARFARSVDIDPSDPADAVRAEPRSGGREPVLHSGVLDDGPVEQLDTTSTGGQGLRLAGAGPRARGLGRAALALDAWAAQGLLREAIDADGVVSTWEGALRPVLRAIVERRQRTGSGIEAQQLLVDCASTALRAVIAAAPEPVTPRPVVLAPVPGEPQGLELVALAAALSSGGVGQLLFGAGVPREGLWAAVRRAAPAAVVLWADQPHYASSRLLAEVPATRQKARLFAAGAGWSTAELAGGTEHVESLRAAADRVAETVLA
ncbi:MerR family transcriptional regulator [Salinifilum ghardaiensis]